MKDILILIVLGALAMFIALLALQAKETGNPTKLIIVVVISGLVLFFLMRNVAECPKCGANSSNVEVDRRYTTNATLETRREFSTEGGTKRNTYWVRKYEDHCKCNKCGHRWIEAGESKERQ